MSSIFIMQGSGRPKSMPCTTTQTPLPRHGSTGSSRLTTSTQQSRNSSSFAVTDSSVSSIFATADQAELSKSQRDLEHELAWYRKLENWDFEREMVKIGPPLKRQSQKLDAEDAEDARQAIRYRDDSFKAILTHLRDEAGCPLASEDGTVKFSEEFSVTSMSTELQDLQHIVSRLHNLEGTTVPAAKLSEQLSRIECLLWLTDSRWHMSVGDGSEAVTLSELRESIFKLILECEDLIDPHQTCVVCGCKEKVGTFPSKITARCNHDTNTCPTCLQKWIDSQLLDKGWNKIKCVECPELIQYEDVRESVGGETFKRYDALTARAALAAIEEFRWCLNPFCPGGQVHHGGARFQCHVCRHQYCVNHGTAWHQKETCDQYDARRKSARIQDQESEKWKAQTTKTCPKCQAVIEKDGGCDHMNCSRCEAQFNWSEAVEYEEQESVPPMDLAPSIALPNRSENGRRFRISKVVRLIFFKRREMGDVC